MAASNFCNKVVSIFKSGLGLGGNKEPPLDPTIWSQLPVDIKCRMAEYLPLQSVWRVCDMWRVGLVARLNRGKCYLHCNYSQEQLELHSREEQTKLYVSTLPRDATLLCVAKGIAAFEVGEHKYAICNVLSGSWIHLPDPPCLQDLEFLYFADIEILSATGEYIFVVARNSAVYVYHSVGNHWDGFLLDFEEPPEFPIYQKNVAALRGSTLFCLVCLGRVASLCSIDVMNCKEIGLGKNLVKVENYNRDTNNLVVCAGKVVLVDMQGILVYNEDVKRWSIISRLPEEFQKWRNMYFFQVLTVASCKDELEIRSADEVWTYNLPSNTWSRLPSKVGLIRGALMEI